MDSCIISFIIIQFFSIVTAKCSSNKECVNETDKKLSVYSGVSNTIISNIKEARREYIKCDFKNCSCFLNVLKKDLEPFKSGITLDSLNIARPRGVKYQLINNRLYRDKECMFPSRCSGVEYFINSIRHKLPDVELIINVRDWPQVSKHYSPALPVFSFSKTNDYYDIMYPAWSFWEGGPAIKLYPKGIGRWDNFQKSFEKAVRKWPWEKKMNKTFFRGSRTSDERDSLILLSRENPALVDAAYTKNQAWKSDKDTLGMPPAEEIALEDHCKYKYLFNFRGVAASFRFKFLFLCNSLVLHVGEDWLEFFYDSIKPWIHYVPVKSGASIDDIENLLLFFKENEDISKEIAEEGYDFIKEHLDLVDVKCYWQNLLTEYSKLLQFKPTIDKSLIDVTR